MSNIHTEMKKKKKLSTFSLKNAQKKHSNAVNMHAETCNFTLSFFFLLAHLCDRPVVLGFDDRGRSLRCEGLLRVEEPPSAELNAAICTTQAMALTENRSLQNRMKLL